MTVGLRADAALALALILVTATLAPPVAVLATMTVMTSTPVVRVGVLTDGQGDLLCRRRRGLSQGTYYMCLVTGWSRWLLRLEPHVCWLR